MDGYQLSEEAARRTAAAVRKVETMGPPAPPAGAPRPVQYKPAFYRLAADAGGGQYSAYAQAWNAEDGELADVTDTHHSEYNRAVTVYDLRGRSGAAVGDAGTGLIVCGWKVWVNGEWVTLVDVAKATPGAGEAATRNYSYRAHIVAPCDADNDPFLTIPDVLNSIIWFDPEIRDCVGDGEEGSGFNPARHPGYKAARLRSANSPHHWRLTVGAAGDDEWLPFSLVYYDEDGISSDYNYGGDPEFQVRVTSGGALEFRIYSNPGETAFHWVLTIGVRVLALPAGMDMPELGTFDCSEVDGVFGCDHEWGIPADPDPVQHPWGDGLWRHL